MKKLKSIKEKNAKSHRLKQRTQNSTRINKNMTINYCPLKPWTEKPKSINNNKTLDRI